MGQVSFSAAFVVPRLIPFQLEGIINLDPWLEPHRDAIRHRFGVAESWINTINGTEGSLDEFSKVCLSNHTLYAGCPGPMS
jgi:hypothetical protein